LILSSLEAKKKERLDPSLFLSSARMASPLGISGVKFALCPTRTQAATLARWIGCQRAVYNAKVDEDRYFWAFKRKAVSLAGASTPIDQAYSQLKDRVLTPWLFEVPSQILRNGAGRWHDAKCRAMRREAGQPQIKRKSGRQSVLLTSELYHVEKPQGWQARQPLEAGWHRLWIGTKKHPVGFVDFYAHRDFRLPKQIVVSRENARWAVSFCFGAEAEDWAQAAERDRRWWAQNTPPLLRRSRSELLYEFNTLSDEELDAATLGVDRGVVNPASDSKGRFYAMDPVALARIERKQKGAKRHQRKLARQQKGSANARKTKRKIAAKRDYEKRARRDWVEKTSHAIATDDAVKIVAMEALNIKAMTKAPAPRPDPKKPGRYLKNGAAAKAGLNAAILASGWGMLEARLEKKLEARNKLLIKVPAAYSSQECSDCGHTHADNRPTQAAFRCKSCGFAAHADVNAPRVLAKRSIRLVRDDGERLRSLEVEAAKNDKATRVAAAKAAKAALKNATDPAAKAAGLGNAGAGRPRVPMEGKRKAGDKPEPGRAPLKQEAPAFRLV
jgi:putative transposase